MEPNSSPTTPTLPSPSQPPSPEPSIFRPTTTSRPPSHRRGVTTPIPTSAELSHLQQQRPLFSPKGHRRRRSSGSRRIKNLWKKERDNQGGEGGAEEQYKDKIPKRRAGDSTLRIKKMKEIDIEDPETSSTQEAATLSVSASPSSRHGPIIDSLKLRADDVIIFVLNNENSTAVDLGFTQASEVWETAGFVDAASALVSVIEVVLRDGMREGVGNFEENIMRMLREGEEMRRRIGEGFSDR